LSRNRPIQVTTAVLVYVILLFSLQIFLLVVAVEGLLDDDPALAWSATALSALLAAGSLLFYRQLQRG
jgi:hypothetical protein